MRRSPTSTRRACRTGKGPLRRYMRDAALAAAADADVVLLLIDATDKRGRLPDRLDDADAAGLGDAARKKPVIIGAQQGRSRRASPSCCR